MGEEQGGRRIIGILAHVDSGKTTLAEALLYASGILREKGRVDHGDSFLDTGRLERQRGITIFSKIARFDLKGSRVILLDTPGHMDFSPEMERSLSVLDYSILVINGSDGVTGRVKRLFQLLTHYGVPILIFVNKMDQPGTDRESIYRQLKGELSEHIMDFSRQELIFSEEAALLSERLMEEYLEAGIQKETMREAIIDGGVFPVWFGSALKGEGIGAFLKGLEDWTMDPQYPEEFSARVFKITRDDQGRRLTEMKITGGSLKNRSLIGGEKVNELRLSSGASFESVQEVFAGDICQVAGLKATRAGQGLGLEEGDIAFSIQPVLSYRVLLIRGGDETKLLRLLQEIEEELPELKVSFIKETGEIFVHIMGEVLLEILKEMVAERSGMDIGVDEGSIIYRETVKEPVLGIGHFEPLRHYAEVHLLLEPHPGREPEVRTAVRAGESDLPGHWQNLILSHILERDHPGVLTGAPLANIRITLVAGRGHEKHTSGGDFREATFRAIRQGLMTARSQGKTALLEPMYDFEIRTDPGTSGRILTDLSRLMAKDITTSQEKDHILIRGRGPAATLRGYEREVRTVTRGEGQMRFEFAGYDLCHDEERVMKEASYDPDKDLKNPSGSIFISQGAGFHVPWQEVPEKTHIPPMELKEKEALADPSKRRSPAGAVAIDPSEVERIIASTGFANANVKKKWKGRQKKEKTPAGRGRSLPPPGGPVYLLVDGYNVIHAWPELKKLSEVNFDAGREKLQEILEDYQGYTGEIVYLVFDAYRVERNTGSRESREGFHVVFTREHETADQYIEALAMELASRFQVKVVTSDSAEQMSALASGALVYSALRFLEIIQETKAQGKEGYEKKKANVPPVRPLMDMLDEKSGKNRF